MSFNSETIDRIVANVMSQLGVTSSPSGTTASAVKANVPSTNGAGTGAIPVIHAPKPSAVTLGIADPITILEHVIIASALETVAIGSLVQVGSKAIITPAAQDEIKARKLIISREAVAVSASVAASTAVPKQLIAPQKSLLIVVKNSKAVDQLTTELNSTWKREFVTCPDDAAKLAISEICRSDVQQIVIIAEQTHRAACLANRNEKVKAVAIRDAGDVRLIRKQLRANVWCVAGTGRTYFELKNLFRELQAKPS